MKRTNIYLDDSQLRLLKHIAVEEGCSFTEVVRQAVREFLERHLQQEERTTTRDWELRLEHLLARVRQRPSAFSPEEIEADTTDAAEEARQGGA